MFRQTYCQTFVILVVALWCLCGVFSEYNTNHSRSTLKLVHVIFRHGDKTGESVVTYPTDPHRNETYQPFGEGQLTDKGRQNMYAVGKTLRNRYSDFLGPTYKPGEVYARTTDTDRTKMSLDLVLAGLYPPEGTPLHWNPELNWQPIPIHYKEFSREDLLTMSLFFCPRYVKLYSHYLATKVGQEMEEKYSNLYLYLTKYTGMRISSTRDVYVLYSCLRAEADNGLQLPSWTDHVFPLPMENAAIEQYTMNSSPELKRLTGGFLLRRIIETTQMKINKTLQPSSLKVFLYSGHELNIAYLLNSFEVLFPHIPPYGAYVLIELHEISGINGIKLLYQDYTAEEPRPLAIPGCTHFCPIEKAKELLQDNVARDTDTCNE